MSNSRNSLATVFLYEIIRNNAGRHLSQKDLRSRLAESPYEIEVSRQTLRRRLDVLEEEDFFRVHRDSYGKYFYDKNILCYE